MEFAIIPARWRASSCRPKLGGALNTSHPPPRPRASAAPCWPIRRRSWSREHRASCGERMRDPSGPRARVSASRERRLEVNLRSRQETSATFKRGAEGLPGGVTNVTPTPNTYLAGDVADLWMWCLTLVTPLPWRALGRASGRPRGGLLEATPRWHCFSRGGLPSS